MATATTHNASVLGATIRLETREPSVSVEDVSRIYEPIRVRRIEVIFSVLGGIVPGEDAVPEDEEEFEIEDEAPERVTSGERVALENVSFAVSGGSCLALVGPPRAGKSVLMRVIAGLAPPTSGRVVVHGRVAPALASTIGMFPRFGRVAGAVPALAALLGISSRTARHKFGEMIAFMDSADLPRKHVVRLSKPDRLSLILTLALHVDADVVLIDAAIPRGPFGEACRERLIELKRAGVLVILTGPTVESVSWIADRVIHMKRGKVVGEERVEVAEQAETLTPAPGA